MPPSATSLSGMPRARSGPFGLDRSAAISYPFQVLDQVVLLGNWPLFKLRFIIATSYKRLTHFAPFLFSRLGVPQRGCPSGPHRSVCLSQAGGHWQLDLDHQRQTAYAEAVSIALACELMRVNASGLPSVTRIRGGLPEWQQKKLTQYIDEHLAEDVSLSSLAELVHLSPYHFSRAFKQSFNMPPHRYLTSRRIERAKSLLAARKLSVTEIGFDVGFSETSSFTSAFRKVTGETPTDYRRRVA